MPSEVDITGYSAMIPVRSECICSMQSALKCTRREFKLYIFTEVYDVTLVRVWRHCTAQFHEWMFWSEENFNGFPLLRELGAMDAVLGQCQSEHGKCTELLMSRWSESGVINKARHAKYARGGGTVARTGIENRCLASTGLDSLLPSELP